jgi:CelD/BcsL family acetyltransferase involved in cellulose biosynthesis
MRKSVGLKGDVLFFPKSIIPRRRSTPSESVEWNGLRGQLLTDWPDEEAWRQWDRLTIVGDYTFFHTPLWQRAVWNHLASRERLRIAMVWQGPELVCALPMQWSRKYGYQTPARHITDYLDPLIAPEGIEAGTIGRLILRLLGDRATLTLHNIRPNAATASLWQTSAAAEGWMIERTTTEQCPMLLLPESVDHWMERLGPHIRKELRRKIRKVIEKGAGRLLCCAPEQAEMGIDQLLEFMQHRGQKAVDVQRTLGPILREAGPELIRRGRLQLSTLMIEDRPAACILEAATPNGLMLYNSGFDTKLKTWSPGLVAEALSIQKCIEHKQTQYDFLRGQEPYKYELGAEDRPLARMVLRPR